MRRRQLVRLALASLLATLPATGRAGAQPTPGDAAIDIAIRSMLDANTPARIAALVAPLAAAGETRATAGLIQLLYWLDPELHPPIAAALATITGADFADDWFAWMV